MFKFLLIIFGLLVFLEIATSEFLKSKSDFKLNDNPKYIVLGHSHPECAFNDSIIGSFRNLSQSGESYFYTFQKAKNIIEQNRSINTVFIEFTNNQIDEIMDEWVWGEKYMSKRYPKYSEFMSMEEKFLLINMNPLSFLNSFSLSFKSRVIKIMSGNYNYIKGNGGYFYLNRDKTDSLINNSISNRTITNHEGRKSLSQINIRYLSQIINLCIKHNKRVVLVRSPLHNKYLGFQNEKLYKDLLLEEFENIEFADFSKFPLTNSEFGDLSHLNYKGARKFSNWFNDLLNKGFLKNTAKQKFINSEFEKLREYYKK